MFFCIFQCFEETKYQTESKQNETFRNVIFSPNVIQETWTLLQGVKEAITRVGGSPTPLGRAPCLVAPSVLHRRTPSSYISLCTPKTSREHLKHNFHHCNLLYPRDLILEPSLTLCRRGNRPWRASTSTSLPLL